jgi:membrane protease YdiL (CAAX protease family)
MAIAITFGLLRTWRGSLIGSITAHAVHNAMLVSVMSLMS